MDVQYAGDLRRRPRLASWIRLDVDAFSRAGHADVDEAHVAHAVVVRVRGHAADRRADPDHNLRRFHFQCEG